jgi:ABC-2 type transport system permease protein
MLKGLWKLTWIETKVFVREPMGVVGSLVVPVIIFLIFGRMFGAGARGADQLTASLGSSRSATPFNVTILAAVLIAVGSVQSLIAIIAIYREGGILKRLRATPLSPVTILGAHVVVKLVFTVASLALLVLAGRRVFPGAMEVNLVSFTAALLLGTLSILTLGFVLASLVPTARFAQPLGAVILYPMVSLSGLFFPVAVLPAWLRAVAYLLPTTHAVALLQGVWDGSGWAAHRGDVAMLIVLGAAFSALSAKVFRWE